MSMDRRSTFRKTGLAALACVALAGCADRNEPPRASADGSEVARLKTMLVTKKVEEAATGAVTAFAHSGGFQTIKGRVRFDGAAPERPPINSQINKEQSVCAPGGKTVLSERLIVNPTGGGVANVVLYVKSEPARQIPVHESAEKPSGDAPSMDNQHCLFSPHVVAVQLDRGKLPLKNLDAVDHNMNILPKAGRASNLLLPKNSSATYEMTAEEAAPFPVTCTIHPWMKGYLLIRDNGYFAVTDAEGNFKIENVPTGDVITVQVWHEAAGKEGGYVRQMELKGGGEAIKPAKEGFTAKLDKDAAPGELEIVVTAAAFPNAGG